MNEPPLILTLRFDETSFDHFEAMRRRYFPAKRNVIPAHLTLFHHLPGDEEPAISQRLAAAARAQARFALEVTGLRFLGFGSAYELRSGTLDHLRAGLARQWADHLTAQDARPFNAHVTIQNKVPADRAKTLFAELDGEFEPFTVQATGLVLWRYLGGPWERVAEFAFADRMASGEDPPSTG